VSFEFHTPLTQHGLALDTATGIVTAQPRPAPNRIENLIVRAIAKPVLAPDQAEIADLRFHLHDAFLPSSMRLTPSPLTVGIRDPATKSSGDTSGIRFGVLGHFSDGVVASLNNHADRHDPASSCDDPGVSIGVIRLAWLLCSAVPTADKSPGPGLRASATALPTPRASTLLVSQVVADSRDRDNSSRALFQTRWRQRGLPRLERCQLQARRRDAIGDMIVDFPFSRGRPSVRARGSQQLRGYTERCVAAALRPFARELAGEIGRQLEQMSEIVAFGTLRPLLPPPDVLLPLWRRATGAPPSSRDAARMLLEHALPSDVRLGADDCLVVTPTPMLAQAVGLWMQQNSEPVHPFWLRGGRLPGLGEETTSAYVLGSGRSLLVLQTLFAQTGAAEKVFPLGTPHPYRRFVRPRNTLCLLSLDGEVATRLSREIEASGRCWRWPLGTVLVSPAFQFPRQTSVATVRSADDGAACALDEGGQLVCCGRTTFRAVPTEHYVQMDAGPRKVCAIDRAGLARCWSLNDGAVTDSLPGTFSRVSAAVNDVCGVRTDGSLACARSDSRVLPAGAFREVNARSSCALRDDGTVHCWSAGLGVELALHGALELAAHATYASSTACALASEGLPSCWTIGSPGRSLKQAETSTRLQHIDVGVGAFCGIAADCRLQCWGENISAMPPSPACFRDLSLGNPSCGVTLTGAARCWGSPFWDGQ
jgi:hypothetical protein